MVASVDSVGGGRRTAGTAIINVPCSLQPMSSGRTSLYKSQASANLFDLFLPLRLEGQAANLSTTIGTEFVVDSVTYRSVGEGVRQGQSGVQRVAVTEVNP